MNIRDLERDNRLYLSNKVDQLFTSLVKDILKTKPKDPVPWMIEWFEGEKRGLNDQKRRDGRKNGRKHHRFLEVLKMGYFYL